MPCKCSSKSRCKTQKCECRKNKLDCTTESCSCSASLCENSILNHSLKPFLLTSEINNQLYFRVTHIKEIVLEYRNSVDLYTGLKKESLIQPHVDHIIETQILSNAIALSYKDRLKSNMIEPLKKSINQNYNYNVTSAKINLSKGVCIKSFLHDGMNKGLPLRSVIIGKYCEKYVVPISNAIQESYSCVKSHIESSRVDDNCITGNNIFSSIAEELTEIINKMDINSNDD